MQPTTEVTEALLRRMLATAAQRLRDRRLHEARVMARAALRLAPKFAPAWNLLGTIHFARNESLAAAIALTECLRYDPDHAAAHATCGELALRGGDVGRARPHLEAALSSAAALSPKLRGWTEALLARVHG